jgi:hypothetical protein
VAEQEMRIIDVAAGAPVPRRAELGLLRPAPVLVVVGTTAPLPPELGQHLLPVLKAVVAAVADRHGVIVTGGTDAGVFHVLRLALDSTIRTPRAVIGVAPIGRLTSPEASTAPDNAPADDRLSALVRVAGDRWGDETPALSKVVAALADHKPTVVLLMGGGDVSQRDLVEHLRHNRTLVIVTGTGRLADGLASGPVGVPDEGAGPGESADGEINGDLRALLSGGDVKHVPLSVGPGPIAKGIRQEMHRPVRRRIVQWVRRRWRTRRERWSVLSVFPRWPFRAAIPAPLLEAAATSRYETLAPRAAEANAVIYPAFADDDAEALVEQNRFRWFQVLAIVGGLLTTVFGAAQAWLQSARWPGVVVATLAAATTALTTVARRQDARQHYLTARLRAERLRSLYFRNLTRPPIVDAEAERQMLALDVANVRSSKPV